MRHDGIRLTREEKIAWMMNAFACILTTEHYAVMKRLTPLSHEDLDVLDRLASSGSHDDLRTALLSDASIEDIILACPFADKYNRHHTVMTILEIINALRIYNLTLKNLEVHIVASIRYVYVSHSGMRIEESHYATNPGMLALIDEYPERVIEITDFRVKRKTNDAALIREALTNAKPLSEGTL